MNRRTILIIITVLLAALPAGAAQAHAALARSTPAAGQSLEQAPAELVLEFTEQLDPAFSGVQLFNAENQLIDPGPGVIDPQNGLVLRLPLDELPRGSYTAIWRVRSLVDGHITEGNVPFGVGVAASAAALIPPPGTPEPATLPPPPLSSALRWLNLVAAALALGALPFGLLVWRPALWAAATTDERQPTTDDRRALAAGQLSVVSGRWSAVDQAMARAARWTILGGGGLLLAATLLFLVQEAARAAGVSFVDAIGAPLLRLLEGRFGLIGLARLGLTLALVALAWRLPPVSQGARRWWLALGLGAALLLTFSLNAHAAAEQEGAVLAVALDWLHVAATVAWLGGLVPLAVALRAARRKDAAVPLARLIPRFTLLALLCVLVLTATGLYSYSLHVGRLDLLAATTYGRALLIKSALFGVLVLLGAVNLVVLSPRLRRGGDRLARAFARTVRLELVIGALLLLAVGALTSVAPSRAAWLEQEKLGVAQTYSEGDVRMTLRVAPARIGDNEFAVDISDRRPGAEDVPSRVLFRFDMVGMDMGELQAEANQAGLERYTARGNYVSMGGRWNVEVILRRAGFEDVRHTFQMDIVRAALP